MSPSLTFAKTGPESEGVLQSLFQDYMQDMAEWFEVETGPDGRSTYDTATIRERGCDVYLAKAEDAVAGFAVIGSAGLYLSRAGGQDVHEFFVVHEFRRRGVGRQMASHLWNEHPGEWLVRVLEANTPALVFWRAAIQGFALGSQKEKGRLVKGRPWVFFRFTSEGTAQPRS